MVLWDENLSELVMYQNYTKKLETLGKIMTATL
jgi:hypothetical protein